MESSKDLINYFSGSNGQQLSQEIMDSADLDCREMSDSVQPSFDVHLPTIQSSKLNLATLATSFEESLALATRGIGETVSYVTAADAIDRQINVENGKELAHVGLNDNVHGDKMLGADGAGLTNYGDSSLQLEVQTWAKPLRGDSRTYSGSSTSESAIQQAKLQHASESLDFGESVALEDFGGDFVDGESMVDAMPQTVDLFAEEPAPPSTSDSESHVESNRSKKNVASAYPDVENEAIQKLGEEGNSHSQSMSVEDVPEYNMEGCDSGEIQEKEAIDDVPSGEKSTKRVGAKKARNQPSEDDGDTSKEANVELNINTRPRRSVARKSVFELLQVEYRGSGGSRKHTSNVPEGDREAGNVVASPKAKKTPSKALGHKRTKETSNQDDQTEDKATNDEDHNDSLSVDNRRHRKNVSYMRDEFLNETASDSGLQSKADGSSSSRLKTVSKSRVSVADKSKSSDSNAASGLGENQLQNSFAAEFELASADVLSNSKSGDDGASKSELDLVAENNRLRARLKALEESNSVVKKFQIDFHSRKFSRIRAPAVGTGQIKTDVTSGSESGKASEVTDVEEAWKSRSALLDRREYKLRELSAELDERASAVRISEGALQRRERKLVELEKTLEYRERVLSRHEQNVQKRELELELGGSGEQAAATDESSAEHGTLIAEFQKRFDLRRQELDRRQNLLQTEREKLADKERELERRERELELKLRSQWSSKESSAGDPEEDVVQEKPVVTKDVSAKTKAKKRSLPLDQPPAKKAKVAVCYIVCCFIMTVDMS